jgi:tripartite-type tricarboxylate transporter receptor subunit TctC
MQTMTTISRPVCALLAGATLTLAAGAQAQTYPTRPIRMVVPFSPGGAADTPGRMLGTKLSEALGQQVILDNRPGAGGTLGAEFVAKASPDGYTLLMISNTHVISAALYKKLNYDPITDFTAVCQYGDAPNVLVVTKSLPVRNVKELIALARARPGQLDFASSGNGSSQHLFAELFMSMTKIKMNHVPYKGSAQATTDVLGGQVPVSFPGVAGMIQHIRTGRIKALAVTSAKRSPELPDVPTIAEAGVPGYEASLWLGILGPAKLSPDVVNKLNGEIQKVLKQPDLTSAFRTVGTQVVYRDPKEFGQFLRSERDKWAKVVKDTGATIN